MVGSIIREGKANVIWNNGGHELKGTVVREYAHEYHFVIEGEPGIRVMKDEVKITWLETTQKPILD